MKRKDKERLAREIEDDKERLADTLSDLGAQFLPDRLLEQISRAVGGSNGATLRQVGAAMRRNPAAAALFGAGAAWLAYGAFRDDDDDGDDDRDRVDAATQRARRAGREARKRVDDVTRDGRDSVEAFADDIRSRLSEQAGHVAGAARSHADDLRDRVGELGDTARLHAADAQRRVSEGADDVADFVRERPLLAGAIAVAAGAALAAALPKLRGEDRAIAETRAALREAAERVFAEELVRAGAGRRNGRSASL